MTPPAMLSVTGSNWIIVVFAFIAQMLMFVSWIDASSITWKKSKETFDMSSLGGSSAFLHIFITLATFGIFLYMFPKQNFH